MKKRFTIPIIILSTTLLFGCSNKSDDKAINEDDIPIIQSETEVETDSQEASPLFDTSKLDSTKTEIYLNDEKVTFSNTISKGPLTNEVGNILVDFYTAYTNLGFDSQVVKTEDDIRAIATDGNRSIYIAINIDKNIKSISINNEAINDGNTKMYILSTDDDRAELLIPLEFIAKSIDSLIVEGETKNSLLLNDKRRIESKAEDNEKNEEEKNTPKDTEKIFKDMGIKIGDTLDQAIEHLGEYIESGDYQGSTYYAFEHITLFAHPEKEIIDAISIFDDKYSIDGIKVGDDIEKIYKKTGEVIPPEEFDGSWSIFYENYKGYKVEFTLKQDQKTVSAITVYHK